MSALRNYNPSSSRSYFGGLHNSGVLRLRNLTLLEFVNPRVLGNHWSVNGSRGGIVLPRIRWGIGVP